MDIKYRVMRDKETRLVLSKSPPWNIGDEEIADPEYHGWYSSKQEAIGEWKAKTQVRLEMAESWVEQYKRDLEDLEDLEEVSSA